MSISGYNVTQLLNDAVAGNPASMGFPALGNVGSEGRPVLLKKRDEDRFRAAESYDRVTPLSAAPSTFNGAGGVQVPWQLNSLQTQVIKRVALEFSITNSTGSTCYPTATPWWVQRIEIYSGANYIETIYAEQLQVYGLIENDTTDYYDISLVQNQSLFFPLNGYHNFAGIVTGTTASYFIELPSHSITSAFIWLPACSAPLRYVAFLNDNSIYTSGQTGLLINNIFLNIEGVRYANDAQFELQKIHKAAPMIMKSPRYQRQVITLGALPASGSITQTLTGMGNGIANEVVWYIRPTAATGANYFENNYQIASLTSITNQNNEIVAQSLAENYIRTLLTSDYDGSFRGDYVYMLPFSLSGKSSSENAKDVGGLILNNANILTLATLASTGSTSYDLIIMARLKGVFILAQDGSLQFVLLY